MPSATADAILAGTAARAAATPSPPAGRRDRRRSLRLLGAAGLVVAVWIGAAATLQVRAQQERDRTVALITADRELHEVDAIRWRHLVGVVPGFEADMERTRHWDALVAAVDRSGDPSLALSVASAGALVEAERAWPPPRTIATVASDPMATELKTLDDRVDAATDRTARAARADGRLAWIVTGAGGLLALLLVTLLMRAYLRAARAAASLRTAAARTEGERRALADSERRFRALVQHASDSVVVVDASGAVTFATDAVLPLLGRSPAALAGTAFAELVEPEQRHQLAGLLGAAAGAAGAVGGELALRHCDGHRVHADVRVADRRADPDVGGIVLTLHDVGERRRLERLLRVNAVRDGATGLANRARFEQWLGEALGGGTGVAVIVLDLDDFGTVNESFGHQAGDRCLAAFAERLRAVAGHRGRLARLSGDEFAMLLEDADGPAGAEREARALLGALAEPIPLDEGEVPLTASVGVALAAADAAAEDVLRCADTALHAAKTRGAGHVEVFTPAMYRHAVRRLELRSALARAVDRDELTIAYQPIVELATGATAGVEALLRWQLDGTPVSPSDFIPVAEATGMIVPLGARVLERACRELRGRERATGEQLGVSVNVSAVQLRSRGFVDTVAGALERSGLPARALTLELTESAMVDDMAGVQATLQAIRDLGVQLAVDDFGTGWSSLATLASLPVDVLKLDRSFVARMDDSEAHAELVGGVVAMADRLGLPTVVEGVEAAAQLDRLRAFGCRFAQGYHLGRPGPLPASAVPSVA